MSRTIALLEQSHRAPRPLPTPLAMPLPRDPAAALELVPLAIPLPLPLPAVPLPELPEAPPLARAPVVLVLFAVLGGTELNLLLALELIGGFSTKPLVSDVKKVASILPSWLARGVRWS